MLWFFRGVGYFNLFLKLINIGLRGSGLLGKFFLLFFMAKWLPLEVVGFYGLISVLVFYSVLASGFDFYSFSVREIVPASDEDKSLMIRDQFVFYFFSYSVVFPFIYVYLTHFVTDRVDVKFIFLLIMVEHISLELCRLLLAIGKPLKSSIIMFMRTGLWSYMVIVYYLFSKVSMRDLSDILLFWIVGGGSAILYGIYEMRHLIKIKLWFSYVDWSWIRSGFISASKFVAATLVLKLLFVIDRNYLGFREGLDVLGVYVFFIGCAKLSDNIYDAAVTMFKYPKILKCFAERNYLEFHIFLKSYIYETIIFLALIALLQIFLMKPILGFIDKIEYLKYVNFYYFLVFVVFLYNISMPFHVALYAMKAEKDLLVISIVSLAVFVFFMFFLDVFWGSTIGVVCVSLTAGCTCLLVLRALFFYNKWKGYDWENKIIN